VSDAEARARAAHGYDENLVVVAGAGSGKTSVLIERLLCQLVERELGSDELVAITFTEKAAAEMRRRLESGLAQLAQHAALDRPAGELDWRREADRAFAWLRERVPAGAIARIATARLHELPETEVTTIHGFCARLLRRFPLEAGVDPDFEVDTGARQAERVEELWERFLAGPDGLEGARAARFGRVLERLDLSELAAIARALAIFELPEDALAGPLPDARAVFARWVESQLAAIDGVVTEPPAAGPESWLAAARPLLATLRERGIAEFQRGLAEASYRRKDGLCGLLEGSAPTSRAHEAAQKLSTQLYRRFARLRQVDDALLGEVLALLAPFAREARSEAQRRGLLPFDALLALARDLLTRHAQVRRALARRYRVLFLDEFQDTDPLQYDIVFLLATESEGAPIPGGKLFIVGDPKQAIYRFRGADIGAYESAVQRVLDGGGAQLTLTLNFRARPEILEPLDRLFRRTFPDPNPSPRDSVPGAYVRYDGLAAARERAGEPRLELWRIGAAAKANDAREVEADVIAGWIAREAGAGRLRFRSVALLMRALTDVHVYVRALQQRGVPVWVGRPEEPEKEPSSQQLVALLRALANPADAPAVLGVLRSPLGGVPDAELGHFRRAGGRWLYTAAQPPLERAPNLARAFAWLRRWHARARSEPLADVLAALRDETPLLALHASARDGQRRALDLSNLLDRLAARAAAGPERGLAELVATLAAEEQRRAAEEPVPESDAVRVLSIHAAKGLEFGTVILPDLARGAPQDQGDADGVEVRFSRELGALTVRSRAALSSSRVEYERLQRVHADAELRRLLYVGATRAQERLVFAQAERARGAGIDTFSTLLGDWQDPELVRRELVEADPARAPGPPPAGATPLAALERAERAAERARAAARPPLARPSGLSEADEEHASPGGDADESLPARAAANRELARALGTALHDVLERWSFKSPAAARALLRAAVARAARLTSVSEEALLTRAGAALDALLASGLPAALARVDVVGRELPLLFEDADGTRWNGTIDLLYRDPADGRLVVADYKSDAAPDPADRARYARQLAVYARGVARLFPDELPPAAELIWLRTGQRDRLPLESPA